MFNKLLDNYVIQNLDMSGFLWPFFSLFSFFSQEHQRVKNKDANSKVLLKTFRFNGLTLRFHL